MYFDQGEERELRVSVMWKRAQGKKKVLSSVNWKERVFVLTPKTLNYFEGTCEVSLYKTICSSKYRPYEQLSPISLKKNRHYHVCEMGF